MKGAQDTVELLLVDRFVHYTFKLKGVFGCVTVEIEPRFHHDDIACTLLGVLSCGQDELGTISIGEHVSLSKVLSETSNHFEATHPRHV